MDVAPGTQIERYTVVQPLGTGGMATVWLARHTRLGSLHALKVLEIPSREVRERLVREGQVQGQVRHPNILAVTDVLEYRECPCLLMEVVTGPALDTYIQQRSPNLDQIDVLARGILAGVAAAHHAGLVHRDLKPANVLLQPDHRSVVPKVADFGLAKVLSSPISGHRTRSGMAMGTPAYMAPEQIRDASRVDTRADVFSLGALLFELCSGTRPFDGPDTFAIFQAVTSGNRESIHTAAPWLPERMRTSIEAALALEPDDRPEDAHELLAMWEAGVPMPEEVWTEDELLTVRESGSSATSGTSFDAMPSEPQPSGASLPLPGAVSDPTFFPQEGHDLEPATWADPGAADRFTDEASASLEPATWADPGAADSLLKSDAPSLVKQPPATEVQRVQRRAPRWLAPAAIAGVALLSAAAWNWHTTRITTTYTSNLMVVGGALTPSADWASSLLPQAEQWRLTTQNGRVLEAMRVNAQDYPVIADSVWKHRLQGIRQEWADGEPHAWHLLASTGAVVQTLHLTREDEALHWRVTDPAGHAEKMQASFLFPFDTEQASGRAELDERGRIRTATWLSAAGAPRMNSDGSYGVRLSYDPNGLVNTIEFLGPGGEPRPNKHGAQSEALHHDTLGLITERHFRGPGGVPVYGSDGFATELIERDRSGAVLGWSYRTPDNTPTVGHSNHANCATFKGKRHRDTHIYTCLDIHNEPTRSPGGWVSKEWIFDHRGYPTKVRFYGFDMVPDTTISGEQIEDRIYDDFGRFVQQGPFYTEDGERIIGGNQFASVRHRYDDRGRVLETTWLGLDNTPMPGPEGPAILQQVWGDCSQPVEQRWFDSSGSATTNAARVHRTSWDPSPDHRTERRRFYDVDGQPSPNEDGAFQTEEVSDEHLESVRTALLGEQGEPVNSRAYWSTLEISRNDKGFETERVFRDRDGRLARTMAQPYSRRTQSHDDRGNPTHVEHFGPDDKPIGVSPLGAAQWNQSFTSAGQITSQELLNGDGEPLPGCARINTRYTPRGKESFLGCFDAAGQPTVVPGLLWHGIENTWDASDRNTSATFVDVGGRPVDTADGYASMTVTYDDTEHSWVHGRLDSEGKPARGLDWTLHKTEHNERLQEVANSWFDADGAPVNQPDTGIAREEYVLNELGRRVVTRSYRADGSPGASDDAIYTQYDDYNAQGRWVHMRTINGWGEPVEHPDWEMKEMWVEYAPAGFPKTRRTGDGRGTLTNDADGVGVRHYDTLPDGTIVGQAYYNIDEEPVLSVLGCHRITLPRDRLSRTVEWRCYGLDGRPANANNGIHLRKTTWGEGDHKLEEIRYNTLGEPVASPKGVWRQRWTYDASDRLIAVACVGPLGAPANCDEGYASRTLRYDLAGNVVSDVKLDAADVELDKPTK